MKLNPGLQNFFFVHLEFKKEMEDFDQKDFYRKIDFWTPPKLTVKFTEILIKITLNYAKILLYYCN